MAANLNKTKRRINSINSTKKITKAMELVATVKLKRFKDIMFKGASYYEAIYDIVLSLFSKADEQIKLQYNVNKDAPKDLIILITSNLGLCGSFNNDSFKFVEKNISKDESVLLTIGNKGKDHFKKLGYEIDESFTSINEHIEYDDIAKLGIYALNAYLSNKYRSVKVIYTKYVNSIKFVPNLINLFPLSFDEQNNVNDIGYSPIYDTDIKTLIGQIIPIYINSTLYQLIVETTVSEQASRRNAMDNANDNADELISTLTLEYNKARQAAITAEITEVVSSSINK